MTRIARRPAHAKMIAEEQSVKWADQLPEGQREVSVLQLQRFHAEELRQLREELREKRLHRRRRWKRMDPMSKLEVELTDDLLQRIRRVAKPFGLAPEAFARTLIRSVVGNPLDDGSATEIAVGAKTLAVRIRQDRAILLADFLSHLELPIPPAASERSLRIDKYQAEALTDLKESLEDELPGDYAAYLELARRGAEKGLDWLDTQEITCRGCHRTLAWQLRSPFHDSLAVHCDTCPKQVEISYYDEVYEELTTLLVRDDSLSEEDYSAAYNHQIENRLIACPCGGAFRFEASRRCPHCSEPIPPRIGDVGEYYSREVHSSSDDSSRDQRVLTEGFWRSDE